MEKMDFPKGTKPREIFVYTCERIAEPLIPLGYKYRKSKNDIYKKDGIFVFSFYFSPPSALSSATTKSSSFSRSARRWEPPCPPSSLKKPFCSAASFSS